MPPHTRLALRVWPMTLALFYGAFVWARPPLEFLGADLTLLSVALFALGALAAVFTAVEPKARLATLPAIMAPPLFRALTLLVGDATTTLAAGEVVAGMAYLTIFTAVSVIYLLSVPVVAEGEWG